jgi:uncharacterized iron-regulated membrane protein
MNRRHLVLFGGCLLAAAALLAAAWVWWDRQPPRETWEVERPERVLSEFAVGQEVKVLFALVSDAAAAGHLGLLRGQDEFRFETRHLARGHCSR